jgi:hypothetical protein
MTQQKKDEVKAANGRKGKGQHTRDGTEISKYNAAGHCMFDQRRLIPGETQEAWAAHEEMYYDAYETPDTLSKKLLDEHIFVCWRAERGKGYENYLYETIENTLELMEEIRKFRASEEKVLREKRRSLKDYQDYIALKWRKEQFGKGALLIPHANTGPAKVTLKEMELMAEIRDKDEERKIRWKLFVKEMVKEQLDRNPLFVRTRNWRLRSPHRMYNDNRFRWLNKYPEQLRHFPQGEGEYLCVYTLRIRPGCLPKLEAMYDETWSERKEQNPFRPENPLGESDST